MRWYLRGLRNYATFTGRASRREYWMFVLASLLILVVLSGVDTLIAVTEPPWLGAFTLLYVLGMCVPVASATVRRLHDTGRAGWWLLVALVPLVGSIILLVFSVLDGQRGENRYGHVPGRSDAPV